MVVPSSCLNMLLVNIPSRSINITAKLRLPSIKFRYGASREQHQKPAGTGGGPAAATAGHAQTVQSGEPIYDFQLPLRFKRKPLSEEEIEVINRGGPA